MENIVIIFSIVYAMIVKKSHKIEQNLPWKHYFGVWGIHFSDLSSTLIFIKIQVVKVRQQ